jgi:hypothetical protein
MLTTGANEKAGDIMAGMGGVKQNKGFRRFLLTGNDKVNVGFGIIALGHNLKRLSTNHCPSSSFFQTKKRLHEISFRTASFLFAAS